jgi:Na+/H+ antiporter NhaD/arsenite permease-like protein
MGAELPVVSVLPFAGLLLAIALLPLVAPHFWHSSRNQALVSAGFALPVAIYLVAGFGADGRHQLVDKLEEYVSFVLLLFALFAISSGIVVRGSLAGTPRTNTAILALGAVLANAIGTTGASLVLIRPLLRANAGRRRNVHVVVFFVFVVSNCGGLLTPLGDPPLFLGFLKGVPFEWTLRLWKEWALVNGALIGLFWLWDRRAFDAAELAPPLDPEPLGIGGKRNLAFLAAVIAAIFASGHGAWPWGAREAVLLALALASFAATPASLRAANEFSWAPMIEVAVLFAGLFVAMTPALLLLNAHAQSLALRVPWRFFWASGLLSSVLDNAPTYLTFAATAAGLSGISLEGRYMAELLAQGERAAGFVAAISCGSVLMGANTYIGNGPNFMVKAIAEAAGVRMPSFFGYMAYSGAILIPLFVVVTFAFML